MHSVKKAVEGMDYRVGEVRREYIAHTFAHLSSKQLDQASDYIERLEELDEVIRVYNNIKEEEKL